MRKMFFFTALLSVCGASASQEYLVKMSARTTKQQIVEIYGQENVVDLNFNNWVKVTVSSERELSALGQRAAAIEKNREFKIQLHRPQRDDGGFIGGSNGGGFIGGGDAGGGFIGGGDAGGGFIGGGDGGGGFIGGGDAGGGFIGGDAGGGSSGGGISGGTSGGGSSPNSDPEFPVSFPSSTGPDVEYSKQWGMADIGVLDAWKNTSTKGSPDMIVAVIDTGVDYTHDELAENIWRNPGESGNGRENNGIDDDGNGFVDDVVGWDFAANDNRPYDITSGFMGNPGHGTHCAGNVAAKSDNGKGIIGVAPNVKIMALRFISEKGSGTTEAAVLSIKYAVDNGAKVLSNSWGSEGDDGDGQVLKEAIQYAMDKGVLFVAAAGNGHQGVGYNNDTDPRPAYPASYDHDNIISVAAIDKNNRLGSFSNWGAKTVDIAAPGVDVYSSIPKNKYMSMPGTSMACPHVAGAAALYWSHNPQATWMEVKNALLNSARPVPVLNGKMVSNGKLNVKDLMNQ
jgi:thermitase